ncbi:MAG: histidine--tRNA ligase [Pyrinomonadaceae bacterium MAG19_C2-C3]|nr:histidine--tRNA ligase [Pyrinomonadaceae bacterium MAG19_C2-C3]
MNTQPARGMRDILPMDARRRGYVVSIIKDVYERYGFEPLETPAIENIETLTGKYGEEAGGLVFKILKRGAEGKASGVADLALRYDLTVPLARVVAEYKDRLPKFFKRFQIQPVYRAERPGRGRFREFYQCDVDAIGSTSPLVEAEILTAACECYARLGFKDFFIKLNHRGVLMALLDAAKVASELHSDALTAIDKLDKIGREGVMSEMSGRGIKDESARRLLELLDALAHTGSEDVKSFNRIALERLVEFIGDNDAGAQGVENLRRILELCESAGIGERIKVDASLARGLSYYTGAIMEASVPDLTSSIGGGGRYDNLIGMFSKEQIPACGFSIGLERILLVMTEREMFPAEVERGSSAQVMVAIWNDESAGESLRLASELRNEGLRVEVYPNADKLGKQFKYAASREVNFVVVIGDEERATGEVAVKDLRVGEQIRVKRESVAEEIKTRLRNVG